MRRKTTYQTLLIIMTISMYTSFTEHVYAQQQSPNQNAGTTLLPKHVLASGVIASSNGNQALRGTIGQPVIGIETNIVSKLQLGFWASVMQNTSGIETEGNGKPLPVQFALRNYPNPFSQSTMISYILPQSSDVRMVIYDAPGKLLREVVSDQQTSGQHFTLWDGRDSNGNRIPSGYYFCTISTTSVYSSANRERSSQRETLVMHITR